MEEQQRLEFHLAFFNSFNFDKSPELPVLKALADMFLNDEFDFSAIKDEKTYEIIKKFFEECDKASQIALSDLKTVMDKGIKVRRNKSTKDRLRDSGLHHATTLVPNGKPGKIISR